MWLYKVAWQHAHWSASIFRKLFNLVPGRTSAVVFFSLVSQLSMMLAFFLPIKVIILMGSPGIPRYFPEAWSALDQDLLVMWLGIASVFFYLMHMVAEKLVEHNAERGANSVLVNSRKLTLFSNQEDIAKRAYHRFAKSLAALFFAIIVMAAFSVFYFYYFSVLVVFFILSSASVSTLATYYTPFREKLRESSSGIVELLTGFGFLLLFAFMLADFILWEGVSIVVAIVSLLLSRQLLQRLSGAIKDAVSLNAKKLQINSIFFHGHIFEGEKENYYSSQFWSLLDEAVQGEVFPDLIADVMRKSDIDRPDIQVLNVQWSQTGLVDVLAFDVTAMVGEDSHARHFLLKVFHPKHKKMAISETDILSADTQGLLPALPLIGVGQIFDFRCNVFEQSLATIALDQAFKNLPAQVLMFCWRVKPSHELEDRYRRSHPLLAQRLSLSLFDRLMAVAHDSREQQCVREVRDRFEEIIASLGRLPLCIINRGINRDCVRELDDGEIAVTHWGRWALEPVGAGYPLARDQRRQLPSYLESAAVQNEKLQCLDFHCVELAAYMFEVERLFVLQKYSTIIEMLPEVLTCLKSISPSTEHENVVSG